MIIKKQENKMDETDIKIDKIRDFNSKVKSGKYFE